MRPILLACLAAASAARADVTTPTPGGAQPGVAAAAVPAVLLREWRHAENRATCAPVWFDDLGAGVDARRRYFGGGWGVTVRAPRWGVAGAGIEATEQDVTRWKLRRTNAAGIRAGYGLEGDTIGPDWLAYLIVPGQRCTYNVWSSLGRAHLEHLIDHLRLVDLARAAR